MAGLLIASDPHNTTEMLDTWVIAFTFHPMLLIQNYINPHRADLPILLSLQSRAVPREWLRELVPSKGGKSS